ncbi:MAG: hypothetical protein E7554_05830 [Ruminococcaceae bacterium]|nr:hypothetical protein [Oscillospiraceae bacterium]
MLTEGSNWIPESSGRILVRCPSDLEELVEQYGFLPYFKCRIPGFSVEEYCDPGSWWCGDPARDPWEWRAIVAAGGRVAYGKLFENKAGFVSRKWYPVLAAYRRDGYDFDSRWDDGLAARREKKIMDVLESGESIPSFELKSLAGFGGDGEKGFESTVTRLMMQTYITIRGFRRRKNKRGEEYGWAVSVYSTPEALWGREAVVSCYHLERTQAQELLIDHMTGLFPCADTKEIRKLLR